MTFPPAAELVGVSGLDATEAQVPAAPALDVAPSAPTDEHLLARFLSGDRDALGTLASRYEGPLLGLACGLTGRRDLALESVQETWLRVIKYGRSFRSGSTVKTWLYRILINTCKDTRAKNARFRLPNSAGGGTGSSSASDAATDPSNLQPPSRDLPHLRAAIDSLTGDQQLLILLCYHHGLTHPQAADVLNIPVGTLKSRLNTTLNTLRASLKEPLA